ncbi:MAG TPA: nucleoside triphosphate pyrophosphatase [Hyphomicrobiales bacterium]|nr:nucleoside triphosphate pyrophosphatase [Hyphomicrobiales bacterium]
MTNQTKPTGSEDTMPIVLASASRIRAEILANAGVTAEIRPLAIDEAALHEEAGLLAPREVALRIAEAKARAGAAAHPGAFVIGADQILSLEGEIFTKPSSPAAAADQLRRLRGVTHRLDSAFACVCDDKLLAREVDGAQLTMRDFSDAFLDSYVEAAGPRIVDSVGGYQLEGLGAQLFERIEGDYFTILGLPLLPLLAVLRAQGLLPS